MREILDGHYPGRTTYLSCPDTGTATAFAHSIAAMSEQERPECIIYVDDIMAGAATATMAQELPQEKIPRSIILRTNPPLIFYPLKNAVYFCYDFDKYLGDSLELLQKALTTRQCLNEKRIHHHVEIRNAQM
jgi:hypothetical protein